MSRVAPLADRFWRKVDKAGPAPAHAPDLGPCWLWTGSKLNSGYGQINRGIPGAVVMVTTHRLAWELVHGSVPEGQWVLHRCDVRRCVNPAHLYVGDHADNVRDAVERARHPHGSKHHAAKHTEEQVAEMRRVFASGASLEALAQRFGVSRAAAGRLVRGNTFKRLPGAVRGVSRSELRWRRINEEREAGVRS